MVASGEMEGWMAKSVKTKVASERVADILAQRILSGELRPGERIKQDELAAELGISRIPVRDALRILETRGLVSLKANAGARVTSLTVKDMDMSYRLREMLEPMLLADSIPRLTDADLDEMADLKRQLEELQDLGEYLTLSRAFHWASFRGHDSPLLAQIVERLWDTTQSYRLAYARLSLKDAERWSVMRAERDLLFRAIRRREADMAAKLLAIHIQRTRMALLPYSHLHELLEG